MTATVSWLLAVAILVLTLRYLPFIDTEAAVRLQIWLRDLQRKIEKDEDHY